VVNLSAGALNQTFSAIADPTRRAILQRLARGEASVKELAAPFDMSLPAISKHVTVLERAGLLRRQKVGRVQRCQLIGQPLGEAAAWLMSYQRFWEAKLDALVDYLSQDGGDGPTDG
jgi:DNA-binding transcriptional ArsR family regulator